MRHIIAHIDMDCFFAAVEEKYNPQYTGKPIIVGALPSDRRGVVATANYAARRYGVRSALPIAQAYRKCPFGIFLRPNKHRYMSESAKVMDVLRTFATSFEQVSVDEAYADITTFAKECRSFEKAGKKIQEEVFKTTGLHCSIGIAESRYVAKIASDFKKPQGLTVVVHAREFLESLPISKISGIGTVTQQVLEKEGIMTIGQLATMNRFRLLDIFGHWGVHLQEIAQGHDTTGVTPYEAHVKSISRETTFQEDISREDCFEYVDELIAEMVEDLKDMSFKLVSIKVRYADFTTITRNLSLEHASYSSDVIAEAVCQLLEQVSDTKPIRLFGIKIAQLKKEHEKQMNILEAINNEGE